MHVRRYTCRALNEYRIAKLILVGLKKLTLQHCIFIWLKLAALTYERQQGGGGGNAIRSLKFDKDHDY